MAKGDHKTIFNQPFLPKETKIDKIIGRFILKKAVLPDSLGIMQNDVFS